MGMGMNERIKQLAEQAGLRFTQQLSNPMVPVVDGKELDFEKFAELLIQEYKAAIEVVWYKQGIDIRGAQLGKILVEVDEKFGVEE
jgi:hypothetical protein